MDVTLRAQVEVAQEQQSKGRSLFLGHSKALESLRKRREHLERNLEERRGTKDIKLVLGNEDLVALAYAVARNHEVHGHALGHAVPQDPAALALHRKVCMANGLTLVFVTTDEARKSPIDIAKECLVEMRGTELSRGQAHTVLVARNLKPVNWDRSHLEPVAGEKRRGPPQGLPQG